MADDSVTALIERAIQAGIATLSRHGRNRHRDSLSPSSRSAVLAAGRFMQLIPSAERTTADAAAVEAVAYAAQAHISVQALQDLMATLDRYDAAMSGEIQEDPMIRKMVAIGGARWQKGQKLRAYFNNWHPFASIDTERYTYHGDAVSGRQMAKLLGIVDKVYYDAEDEGIHVQGSRPEVERYMLRLHDGSLTPVNLEAAICDGIWKAIDRFEEGEKAKNG